MCRYGTPGHGLAGMVVLGWQLHLMILEVFSNLDDAMIQIIAGTHEWSFSLSESLHGEMNLCP